jgi:D-ribose pyranose/furanose isomerase RbsD
MVARARGSTVIPISFVDISVTGAVPSLKGAAKQLNTLKKELNLNKVFLASDATEKGTMYTSYRSPSVCGVF